LPKGQLHTRDKEASRSAQLPGAVFAIISYNTFSLRFGPPPQPLAVDLDVLIDRFQGSSRSCFACLNHFRNMSSVSIISVKPARLIFTVETIEGGPDSVWP
jgi:hypothetical protein